MISKISQNYNWLFKEQYEEKDLYLGNIDGFISVNIPHTIKETPLNNFDETITHQISTYKKFITIEDLSKIYHLIFEGIGHYSKLYVNGHYVNDHKCGFTRFKSNITPFIKEGKNEIALVVNSHEINQPPFGFVIDYLCFGGIYRECYLEVLNDNHIKDYYFHNDKKKWYLDYSLNSAFDGVIKITLLNKDEEIVFTKDYSIGEKIEEDASFYTLWDVDNPYLYTLEINLIKNGEIIDFIKEKIGFRTIDFKEKGFYLNGKKLKIRGVNRHQSYPYIGYAMPKRGQVHDAIKIKELGFNAVRTSHYPQSPHFLKACDELGLLVFEEIPGWQYIGDESWKEIAIKNVKDMIKRDKNHPSIILWGVRINESPDDHDFYIKTNKIAHIEDPYRPTGGVRCFAHSELLEDIYTYNDFVCSGKNLYLRNKLDVTISKLPYMVTEYGGHMFPTKSFDSEIRRTEHALIHANVLKAAYITDEILATFAWCFADYNTHKDFGSGDLICYHGILDIFRNPKYAAYPYMIHGTKPFLEISSNLNIGEHNGGYIRSIAIFTNLDEVKMYHNKILVNTFKINNFPVDGCIKVSASDLLGNILEEVEYYNKKDSLLIKQIVEEILSNDGIIRQNILEKYGEEITYKAWNLYGKYVSNWGSKASAYKFEGYKNGIKVKEIFKGPQYFDHYEIDISNTTLLTEESYDVTKITIMAVGNLGNKIDYCFDALNIETSSNLEVIGGNLVSLIGGSLSVYIKSREKEGRGIIKINNSKGLIKEFEVILKENN